MARTNEEQLELFADLVEPMADIMADDEIAAVMRPGGGKLIHAVSIAYKKHKPAIIQILARLDNTPVEKYVVPDVPALWQRLVDLINQPSMQKLFTSQGQMSGAAASGSATEITEGGAN